MKMHLRCAIGSIKSAIWYQTTLLALILPALGGQIDFENLNLRAGQNKGRAE